MKNNTNNIVDYINKKTNLKDKRVYMSLLYLNKYILKDTVIKDFGKISKKLTDNNWLEIMNSEGSLLPMVSVENINIFLERKFRMYDNAFGKDFTTMVKENFENIGLFEVLKDTINTNKFIKFIDTQSFILDDIFDIYSQINSPDRNKNDFFTPFDLCNGIAKLNTRDWSNKKEVKVYDCCCGIGNLLYSTFKEIKENYPDLKIVIFGNDIDKTYYSFSNSLFNLFNQNNSYFSNENILRNYTTFGRVNMDLIVGNPPFGAISTEDYDYIMLKNGDKNKTPQQIKYTNQLLKKIS